MYDLNVCWLLVCFMEVKFLCFNKCIYNRYDLFEKCSVFCVDKYDYLFI